MSEARNWRQAWAAGTAAGVFSELLTLLLTDRVPMMLMGFVLSVIIGLNVCQAVKEPRP